MDFENLHVCDLFLAASSGVSLHQNLCIVFDAYSTMSPTDIDEIRHSSTIFIYFTFVVASVPHQRSHCSKEKLLLRQTPTSQADRDNAALLGKILPGGHLGSLGMTCQTILFMLTIKWFLTLYYPKSTYLSKHLVPFALIGPRGWDSQFIMPLALIISLTSSVWRARLHCHHLCSLPSESLSFSWIIGISNSLWIRPNDGPWATSGTDRSRLKKFIPFNTKCLQ
jgi:hypothetical protein